MVHVDNPHGAQAHSYPIFGLALVHRNHGSIAPLFKDIGVIPPSIFYPDPIAIAYFHDT